MDHLVADRASFFNLEGSLFSHRADWAKVSQSAFVLDAQNSEIGAEVARNQFSRSGAESEMVSIFGDSYHPVEQESFLNESGLTIAELLVCMGVIAILVSISYPLLEEYRTRAWNTHPMSDLRNAVIAVQAMPESFELQTCHGAECEAMYPGLKLSDCTQMSLTPASANDMLGVACCRKGNRTLGNRYFLYSPESGQVVGMPYSHGVECMLGSEGSSSGTGGSGTSGTSSTGSSGGSTAGATGGSSTTSSGSGTTGSSGTSGGSGSCGGVCSSCANTCMAGLTFNGCMQANATGPLGIELDICICVASCLPSVTSSGLLGSSSGIVAGLVSGVASTGLVSSSGTVTGISGSGSGTTSGSTTGTSGTATSGSGGLLGGVAAGVAGTVAGPGLVSGSGAVTAGTDGTGTSDTTSTGGSSTTSSGVVGGVVGGVVSSSGLLGGVAAGVSGTVGGSGLVTGTGSVTTGGGTTTGTPTTSSGLVGGVVGGVVGGLVGGG